MHTITLENGEKVQLSKTSYENLCKAVKNKPKTAREMLKDEKLESGDIIQFNKYRNLFGLVIDGFRTKEQYTINNLSILLLDQNNLRVCLFPVKDFLDEPCKKIGTLSDYLSLKS